MQESPIADAHHTRPAPKRNTVAWLVFWSGAILLLAALIYTAVVRVRESFAPDFTLTAVDGREVSLSDVRGKTVLLNFWASWCAPCREEMPALESYYQANRADSFEIIAINVGETRKQAQDFAAELGLTFPIVLDGDASVAARYRVFGLPVSVLVDKNGMILYRQEGQFTPESLEREITPRIGR